jgi:hypothetical protein
MSGKTWTRALDTSSKDTSVLYMYLSSDVWTEWAVVAEERNSISLMCYFEELKRKEVSRFEFHILANDCYKVLRSPSIAQVQVERVLALPVTPR